MKIVYQITLGVLFGVVFFFTNNYAYAITIDNTKEDIRDDDIIATELDIEKQEVKLQYWGDLKTTDINVEVIASNAEKVNNSIKVYPSDQYVKDVDLDLWFHLEYATTTVKEWNDYNTRNLDKVSILKYIVPTAIAASSFSGSGDGDVRYNNFATWSTGHDAANGTHVDYTATACDLLDWKTGGNYYLGTCFLPFNTNGLWDDSTHEVSSSSIHIKKTTNNSCTGNSYAGVVETDQAAYTTLTTQDWDNRGGSTLLSDYQDVCSAASGWFQFTLTSSGIDVIVDDGYTPFAIKGKADLTDDAAILDGGDTSNISFASSDTSGTSDDPYLLFDLDELPAATSTPDASSTPLGPAELPFVDDITIITGYIEHYETSTTTPDSYDIVYYRIPLIAILLFAFIFFWIGNRLLLELIIRWRH